MKHYLFWEKQSIKEFWEKGLFIDKVFMITYLQISPDRCEYFV